MRAGAGGSLIPRRGLALAAALGACTALGQQGHLNLSTGKPLQPGVYGRIAPGAEPPPLIHQQPVIATRPLAPDKVQPVYLYVPPGQVRKWPRHCQKWNACDLPVLFVRVDDSPSRLGAWKRWRDASRND
jgi:hypothetical protein